MNGGLSTLFLRFLKKFVILPPTPREGMGIMRRVALVTGASRGIGRGIALELAREGWDLCINYLQDRQAAETAAEEIRALEQPGSGIVVKGFVSEEELAALYAGCRLVVVPLRYGAGVKGKVVEAPPKELELLNCLASHPNRVYTRDQLLDEVWGFEYYGDSRTIDVHVKRLREKLAGASDKWELKTVWGVGYKFEVRQ